MELKHKNDDEQRNMKRQRLETETISSINNDPCDPHDLPDEFKQLGWRKCYSSREKRHYYFNKFTHESLWNLNDLFELVSEFEI